MNSIRLAFLVAAFVLSANPARSDEVLWEADGWKVAFTKSDGRLIGCHSFRDYSAGTRLVVALHRSGEWWGLLGEHRGQPDFSPGAIQFLVDGKLVHRGRAERISSTGGVRLGNLHPSVIDELSRGRVLEITGPAQPTRRLSLSGSEDALTTAEKCVAAVFSSEQKINASRGVTYRVVSNLTDGVLNMRTEPSREAALVTSIPVGTTGLRPLGHCLPAQDRHSARTWCKFQLSAVSGWVVSQGVVEDLSSGSQSPPAPVPPTAASVSPKPEAPPAPTATSGTAFFVSKVGHLLTNAHVVKECRTLEINQPGTSRPLVATVLAKDRHNDLALLLAPGVNIDNLPPMRRQVRVGEDVAAFGYPLAGLVASSGNFTRGNVTALAGLGDDTTHMQMAVPIQPGNSGGPVVDYQGNVVGVVVSKLNAMSMVKEAGVIPEQINFAIKASTVASFLEAHGQSLPEATGGAPTMSPPDLHVYTKQFTMLVTCRL